MGDVGTEDNVTALDSFIFSQGSLGDYVTCPRRFQLRYLLETAWPAPEMEPIGEMERQLEQGRIFHRLVQQHALGIPVELLTAQVKEKNLAEWWQNYLACPPPTLPAGKVWSEIGLSTPLGGRRLMARCDRVVIEQGVRMLILDWKTDRRQPPRERLAQHMQTRVYRYVMAVSGSHLNGGVPPSPSIVEMIYWYAKFPDQVLRFPYSEAQQESDGAYLCGLIEEILSRDRETWTLTDDMRRCRYCRYRSLCKRDVEAGVIGEAEEMPEPRDPWDFDLELEQIAEVAF